MAKKGWFAIRNIPSMQRAGTPSPYYYILLRFFSKFELCHGCQGRGYTYTEEKRETVADTSIKIHGIKDLEKIKCDSITDTIREILEYQLWGKRRCEICDGFQFIPKRKKLNKVG